MNENGHPSRMCLVICGMIRPAHMNTPEALVTMALASISFSLTDSVAVSGPDSLQNRSLTYFSMSL